MRSGVSPERTRTSSASMSASRAARTAWPVPSGRSCTATSTPSNAEAVSGEATTTSRAGSSGRAASTTQSTMRRPRIGCRCFGSAERIRVPSPPAITTAASLVGITVNGGWGARIRTWDHGTKTRCLTTWPRPRAGTAVYPDRQSGQPGGSVSAGREGAPRARARRAARPQRRRARRRARRARGRARRGAARRPRST